MAQQSPAQKQPYSVYTVMLIASTLFMLFACILMGVEFMRWQ